MDYRIAPAGATTGRTLQRLVGPLDANAVVCWGIGYQGPLPALNAAAGRLNKMQQAQRLIEGLPGSAIAVLTYEQALNWFAEEGGPLLGRKAQHSQGKDIVPILERWQLEATRGHLDFYTPYLASVGEYRTWVYRNRHLGSYKKVLKHPEEFKRLGRNFKNGFRFDRVENEAVPEAVKDLSRDAIKALSLDFGAVDLLELPGSRFVVLEVNSAPGVVDDRRQVIQNLAHRIQRWVANGCPGRT